MKHVAKMPSSRPSSFPTIKNFNCQNSNDFHVVLVYPTTVAEVVN